MKIKFVFLFVLFVLSQSFVVSAKLVSATEDARNAVRAAMEAMGGEAKLRELKTIQFEGIGHTFMIEQSERPEGPWIPVYNQMTETRDYAENRVRSANQTKFSQIPDWTGATTIVAAGVAAMERDGKFFPGQPTQVQIAEKNLALAPERIFFHALEADDLRLEKDVSMQGVRHRVLKFTWNQIPVTVFLNADTNLPTAVETLEFSPYDHFYSVWGDFTNRIYYSFWNLEKSGLRYPRQRDTERLGKTLSSLTIIKMQINPEIKKEDFAIPDDVKQKFAAIPLTKIDDLPLGLPNKPASEIAPKVIKIPGRWDVAVVKQDDGIVIIEAPIGSGYSVKVLEEARKRFPDAKVKAVITTSDAFPHLGGVREYVAQNIPIYALDVNRPILEQVINAPHSFQPDNLQKNKRRANFKIVTEKTVLGTGANRLELYPIRSETGERMMMIYFPDRKLLYASDLIQKRQDGSYFMPQYLSEVMQAVAREKLPLEKVFAMHSEITPWSEIVNAVEKQITDK